MADPQILWRVVNRATLSTLRGESRGQYDIRLTRPEGIADFFDGAARTPVTDLGGFTLRVKLERAVDSDEAEVRVRYMGEDSERRDWYIASQRPDTAYRAWRLGDGLPVDVQADDWLIVLLRDQAGRFHGRVASRDTIRALPDDLNRVIQSSDVGVRTLDPESWAVLAETFQVADPDAGPEVHASDELVLVLDALLESEERGGDLNLDEVVDLLRRVRDTAGDDPTEGVDGTEQALSRFRELIAGAATRGGDPRDEVWNAFVRDGDLLRATAAAIRANLENPEAEDERDALTTEAVEGRILTSVHRRRERSRALRQAKIDAAGQQPTCEACTFDFAATYGDRGQGFIECHHKVALAELRPGQPTRVDDLALVCANCHRMIHSKRPWLTMDELVVLVAENRP